MFVAIVWVNIPLSTLPFPLSPFPFPCPFPKAPSPTVGPLKLGSLVERCNPPSGVWGGAPAEIEDRDAQNTLWDPWNDGRTADLYYYLVLLSPLSGA